MSGEGRTDNDVFNTKVNVLAALAEDPGKA